MIGCSTRMGSVEVPLTNHSCSRLPEWQSHSMADNATPQGPSSESAYQKATLGDLCSYLQCGLTATDVRTHALPSPCLMHTVKGNAPASTGYQ